MPVISQFYGILIYMYREIGGHHNEPHVHIKYNEYKAVYNLDGIILEGKLPKKQQKIGGLSTGKPWAFPPKNITEGAIIPIIKAVRIVNISNCFTAVHKTDIPHACSAPLATSSRFSLDSRETAAKIFSDILLGTPKEI